MKELRAALKFSYVLFFIILNSILTINEVRYCEIKLLLVKHLLFIDGGGGAPQVLRLFCGYEFND